MEMTSFAPDEFFWGGRGKLVSPQRYIQENSIFLRYPIITWVNLQI